MTNVQPDQESPDERDGTEPETTLPTYRRLPLIGALIKFQVKLLLDGLRDLALSPLSILAVLLGIVGGGDAPDRYFRQVLHLGRRSERWINLFGRYRGNSVDDLLGSYEQEVADELQRRGWSDRAERLLQKGDLTQQPRAKDARDDNPRP